MLSFLHTTQLSHHLLVINMDTPERRSSRTSRPSRKRQHSDIADSDDSMSAIPSPRRSSKRTRRLSRSPQPSSRATRNASQSQTQVEADISSYVLPLLKRKREPSSSLTRKPSPAFLPTPQHSSNVDPDDMPVQNTSQVQRPDSDSELSERSKSPSPPPSSEFAPFKKIKLTANSSSVSSPTRRTRTAPKSTSKPGRSLGSEASSKNLVPTPGSTLHPGLDIPAHILPILLSSKKARPPADFSKPNTAPTRKSIRAATKPPSSSIVKPSHLVSYNKEARQFGFRLERADIPLPSTATEEPVSARGVQTIAGMEEYELREALDVDGDNMQSSAKRSITVKKGFVNMVHEAAYERALEPNPGAQKEGGKDTAA